MNTNLDTEILHYHCCIVILQQITWSYFWFLFDLSIKIFFVLQLIWNLPDHLRLYSVRVREAGRTKVGQEGREGREGGSG